ncbi:MAG: hypothetical protein ACTHU0_22340 [Kofleriaceae bacterium]
MHRLLDIVAEEVSLVDRAANQRRFLIVKRSESMEDLETEDLAPTEGEPAEKASPGDHRLVDTALTALERLTETVETLSVLADGDARESIGGIAAELRSLAEDLVGAAGGAEPTGAEPVAAAAPTSVGAATPDQVATLIASVRAALAEVGTLLGESKRARPKPEAPDDAAAGGPQKKREPDSGEGGAGCSPRAPAAAPAPGGGPDPMRKELAALTEAMTKLVEATKGHTQRLAHLEKRFGLPNSLPTREQPAADAEAEVGWPLDLNRPFHREAVDKSVSFHDL